MIQTDNGGDMMYFYQVLQSCDEFKVVSEFLAIIKCQDKCSVNKRCFKDFISEDSKEV